MKNDASDPFQQFFVIAATLAIQAFAIMQVWNRLLVELFALPVIDYWLALMLVFVISMLIKK